MKRAALVICLMIFLLATPSLGAAKVGAKCSKAGETIKVSGSKLVCKKKSGRLSWQKGKVTKQAAPSPRATAADKPTIMPIPIASPSVAPIPSISPKPTPANTPTPLPTPKALYFDFKVEDRVLYRSAKGLNDWKTTDDRSPAMFDAIRAKAFEEIKSVVPRKELVNQTPVYYVAPNVNLGVKASYEYLITESLKYFDNWMAPNTPINIHIYTEKDRDYFRESMQIYVYGNRKYERLETDLRNYDDPNSGFSPGGGVTSSPLKSDPQNNVNIASYYMSSRLVPEKILMYLIPHELSHHWQFANLQPLLRRQGSERSSCNFLEGTAVLLGSSITVNNVGWYSDEMDVITRRIARDNPTFKPTTEQDIVEELMRQSASTATNGLACSTGYSLGAIAYEWLVAEKGISVLNELIKGFNSTTSVSDGIKLATGWTDREFYTRAAPYVLRAWKSAISNN